MYLILHLQTGRCGHDGKCACCMYRPEDVDMLASGFTAFTHELSTCMRSNISKLTCDKTGHIWITTAKRQRTFLATTVTFGGVAVSPVIRSFLAPTVTFGGVAVSPVKEHSWHLLLLLVVWRSVQ